MPLNLSTAFFGLFHGIQLILASEAERFQNAHTAVVQVLCA